MRLDSVRSLKLQIAEKILPEAVDRIQEAGGFSITTFSRSRVTGNEPTMALGIAPGAGRDDHRLAVRIQRHSIERARPMLAEIERLAKSEVDMRYIGRVAKQTVWYRQKQRPLLPGISVAHHAVTAGTLGAFVRQRRGRRKTFILSNNHVLANEDEAEVGDPILQPGSFDGGRKSDAVAHLTKWVRFKRKTPNRVDAAIAEVDESTAFEAFDYRNLGRLAGVRSDALVAEMSVAKLGRTTGLTRGRVTAVEMDGVVVAFDAGLLSFDDQIEIESAENRAFSSGGDSGSLIIDEAMRACALLFAGSESGGAFNRGLTYANPIGNVLDALAIELLTP